VLKELVMPNHANLLVGFETSDDAAVYRLSPDTAVISTVDFITPPVDDPYWFGQIAAANSLSDVYAMGGKPIFALNLVMFPSRSLDLAVLKEILRGGNDKVVEAGACMAGGHSVDDNEPKYGLSVTGVVHPDRIWTNAGARAGDALVLTKPLGTGVLFNANRSGRLPYRELEAILPTVASLNAKAFEAALRFEVHACTDITGFGILGHSVEIARASGVRIELAYRSLPIHPDALAMYRKGETTGSNKDNRRAVEGFWESKLKLAGAEEELLFDPQTSGGLLLSLPDSQADELVRSLKASGVEAASCIGRVVPSDQPLVSVV
jgi:selenide,water dikinase